MAPIKKVCVFGVGGVGGYFGGKIAQAIGQMNDPGYEIYYIARGEHLNVIKKDGLRIVTPDQTIVGINFEWADDPFPAIWEKYMFIAAFGLISAQSGKTLGEIMADTQLKNQIKSIMTEIFLISKQKGIGLPDDIIERSIAKADNFPFETKTSYQRDIEQKGSINEGDLYGGFITRQGQALGVPTPATQTVYAQIQQKTGQ